MNIIFLDTETTGNTSEDRLCQLGYIVTKDGTEMARHNELYNPGKKIPPEASAVTHITNKMVADKPLFKESAPYASIKDTLEDEHAIIVAHNAKFDITMLSHESITPKDFICTLKLARYLDKENKIPRYNLQYLRYYLEIEIEAPAHDAFGDVLVLKELFPRLYSALTKEMGIIDENEGYNEQVIKKMIEISKLPSLVHSFGFGKHIGKTVSEVALSDPGYLEWLLNQKLQSEHKDAEEDWIYTLEYYLKK